MTSKSIKNNIKINQKWFPKTDPEKVTFGVDFGIQFGTLFLDLKILKNTPTAENNRSMVPKSTKSEMGNPENHQNGQKE